MSGNYREKIDWARLRRLRSAFVREEALPENYWQDQGLMEDYDQTLAQRIGWKWDAVLRELKARGWEPPSTPQVLDWACGTGIASRRFTAHFSPPSGQTWTVSLFDRSQAAAEFAFRTLKSEQPEIDGNLREADPGRSPLILLVSHVITELPPADFEKLMEKMINAEAFIWVEQGTHIASRKLIAAREILRKTHHIVAPCTHQNACGLLAANNAPHWCHHFAKPPGEVFRSAFWQEFTKELNIDLHSLPVSYLVGQKQPTASSEANLARVIGYARLYKGYCKFLACAHDGVKEKRLQKRDDKKAFKTLEAGAFSTLIPEALGEDISPR